MTEPLAACVHHLVERQALRTPEQVAVVFGERSLSYRLLDREAARWACRLRQLGVGPDVLVGLCVERSLEMAVGLLAILKAGGAYVPLDPAYPRDRLAWIVEDTRAPVLLTQRALAGVVPAVAGAQVVFLDEDEGDGGHPSADELGPSEVGGEQLAYVIYTSGSTGRPKGICMPHRALVNLLRWHDRTLLRGARTLQFASLSFDASFHEMFAAWMSGGTVYLITEANRRDVAALARFLEQHAIEKAILPVVIVQHLAEQFGAEPARFRALRELTTTGEQLHVTAPMVRLLEQMPGCTVHNHYGPSETHVVTAYTLPADRRAWPSHPPIGRAIDATTLHVLDDARRPVADGEAGELYIGGASLAHGYLRRTDLTAERFVTVAIGGAHERLYKTGDLVRWRDGELEFLGRLDHQVKIRGFRVELGEIEGNLTQHDGVLEAVVLAREDRPGEQRLVAYVVPAAGGADDVPLVARLRSYLRGRLPDYMVPAAFVIIDAMPLTANGKVDRRALPAPGGRRPDLGHELVPPRTAQEATLAAIWEDVLGIDQIGVHDDFFAVGGDSLSAVKVFARLRQRLGVEVSFQTLFTSPTIAGFVDCIAAGATPIAAPLVAQPHAGLVPLSFAQERIWFLHHMAPASGVYNCLYAFRVVGALDRGALDASLVELAGRHSMLRTTFPELRGEPRQQIQVQFDLRLEVSDLRAAGDRQEAALGELLAAEAAHRFDLARGPLIRAGAIQLDTAEHVLWFNLHHIINDGRSMEVLFRELAVLYGAATAAPGSPPSRLPPLPIQYTDYALWQRRELRDDVVGGLVEWWRSQLAGAPPLLELPSDRRRPSVQSFRGASVPLALDRELTDALRAVGAAHATTLTMVVLSGFAALLHRYTDRDDLVIGVPSLGRDRVETESVVGFFVNTLPVRLDLTGRPTFAALLQQVRRACLEAFEHDALPFERIVQELHVDRSPSYNPLVQVAIAPQPPGERDLNLPGLSVEHVALASRRSVCDLTLYCWDTPAGLSASLEYATDLFDRATVERMAAHLHNLLAAAAAAPTTPVGQLAMLSAVELRRLVLDHNDTARPYLADRCYHELVAAQAARTPDALSVVEPAGRALTYAALDAQANQLAHHLRALGVGPDDRVGLCTERSVDYVVGLLAILKAGGAFVPLDPTYPRDRLAWMVSDAEPRALVTQSSLASLLPAAVPVVRLDGDAAEIARQPTTAPPDLVAPHHLAYVIYTSGSTGTPKGVMIEHRSLVNLAEAERLALGITAATRVLQFSAPCFDASVWELATALTVGATVCLMPPGPLLLGAELGRFLRDQRITVATLVPSVLRDVPAELATTLETVVAAGEPCTAELTAAWASGRTFINAYGPTECAVCATLAVCTGDTAAPPIGRPIANVRVYVLDREQQPVPAGVAGELYIGGVGVGRGYLRRPELTAERFVSDPFDPEPGRRMYRTGDVVRWRSDGLLEFIGRRDAQVKVRGFRIELGEVEAALREHAEVHDVAVVADEGRAGRRLVAYVVPAAAERTGEPSLPRCLRAFVSTRLPAHMVPAEIAVLDRLPLTRSGKLDRAALPAPGSGAIDETRDDQAARSPVEQELARLWSELLGLPWVGVHDDFFALGGDSMMVSRLTVRIQDRLGVDLPLRALYEAPTVARLARLLEDDQRVAGVANLCYTPSLRLDEECGLDDTVGAAGRTVEPTAPPRHIFLTGATGFVGAFLLAELLARTTAHVSCLVRARSADDGRARLRRTLASFGLPADALDGRVDIIAGELATPGFGLAAPAFDALAERVDSIVHSAARVDHVRGYAQLKPANVTGTAEVLRFASHRRIKPVHYISTLGTVYPPSHASAGVIPESALPGPLALLPNGYMQSKCVAEEMVRAAGARGIPTATYRLGAITGHSVTGVCNAGDYTYSAIRTTLALGFADDLDSDLTITPVDYAARAIAALVGWPGAVGRVFHITHPQPWSWLEMVEGLRRRGHRIEIMSYAACMNGLLDVARRGIDTPMLAFLPFIMQRVPGASRYIAEDYYVPVRWGCDATRSALTSLAVEGPPPPETLLDAYLEFLAQSQLISGLARPGQRQPTVQGRNA